MVIQTIVLFIYFHSSSHINNQNLFHKENNLSIIKHETQTQTQFSSKNQNDYNSIMKHLLTRILKRVNLDIKNIKTILNNFEFQFIPKNQCNSFNNTTKNYGCFNIFSKQNIIIIQGNSISLMSSGFNYYMTNYLKSSISWNGNNININKFNK